MSLRLRPRRSRLCRTVPALSRQAATGRLELAARNRCQLVTKVNGKVALLVVSLGDRLRLPLSAPAEQSQRAEAGGGGTRGSQVRNPFLHWPVYFSVVRCCVRR
jgi:hypothetical protein